jgi:hypothetical protein
MGARHRAGRSIMGDALRDRFHYGEGIYQYRHRCWRGYFACFAGYHGGGPLPENENDSVELQVVGTPFQLAAGHPLYFGAKLSISDATQSDLFIGLASKDPNIIAAHAIALADDGVYFYKLDGGTVIYGAEEKSGTVAATACGTAMDISKHIYEIYYDGVGSVSFYFDGGLVVKASSGYPTVVLSPSVGRWCGRR